MVRPPSTADFDVFYDDAMPIVYGYLVRLCGGDTEQAWDLTQDTWVAVVDQLQRGRSDCKTISFVLTVARSRYLDMWRRRQRLQRKLRLVWAADRQRDGAAPSRESVLDHVAACSPRPSDGADDGVRRRHTGGADRRAARLLAGVGLRVAGQSPRRAALTDRGRSVMNERYEDVRLAPDRARAEELRQSLHARMTSSAPRRVAKIDEEVIVSQNPIRHRSRSRIYLAGGSGDRDHWWRHRYRPRNRRPRSRQHSQRDGAAGHGSGDDDDSARNDPAGAERTSGDDHGCTFAPPGGRINRILVMRRAVVKNRSARRRRPGTGR